MRSSFFDYISPIFYEASQTGNQMLKQKKSSTDHNVMFYSHNMLIKFISTLFTDLQLMEIISHLFLERTSSMPLEHKFKLVRIRCRNINTFKKFQATLVHIQTYANLDENETVNGRKNSFGVVFSNDDGEFFDEDYE